MESPGRRNSKGREPEDAHWQTAEFKVALLGCSARRSTTLDQNFDTMRIQKH